MVVQQRSGPPATTRFLARALVVIVMTTLLVPIERSESIAIPVTLSETVDGIEADPDSVAVGLADAGSSAGEPPTSVISAVTAAPLAFSALGVLAPDGTGDISVRTSPDGVAFSDWEIVSYQDLEGGPDPDSAEDRAEPEGQATEILWVGEATHVQFEVQSGSPEDLEVTFIDSMRLNGGPVEQTSDVTVGAEAGATDLNIVPRSQWGADESLGKETRRASEVHMIVVHHTAHRAGAAANNYSRAEAPGIMRAMHRYHTASLGWADLGYNLVIDRYGTIYEGRKGGFANGVIGAHSAGYNTGSFGVSVIGEFRDVQAPPAAIDALTRVVGAAAGVYGIDPTGLTAAMGNGTARPTVVGHRDVGNTACPGRIHALLPQIRADARPMAVRFPDVPSSSPHREAILNLADAGVTSGCRANAFCPEDRLSRGQASSFVAQAFGIPGRPGQAFGDVPSSNVHAGAINALGARELMRGYQNGEFGPWDEMSRAHLATLLARSMELSTDRLPSWAPPPYPDVPVTHTHAPAIAALKEAGVVGDCGGGRFCPDEVVRRDSTASFVHMVMQVQGVIGSEAGSAGPDDSGTPGAGGDTPTVEDEPEPNPHVPQPPPGGWPSEND